MRVLEKSKSNACGSPPAVGAPYTGQFSTEVPEKEGYLGPPDMGWRWVENLTS